MNMHSYLLLLFLTITKSKWNYHLLSGDLRSLDSTGPLAVWWGAAVLALRNCNVWLTGLFTFAVGHHIHSKGRYQNITKSKGKVTAYAVYSHNQILL
jgi:hypothetical protein